MPDLSNYVWMKKQPKNNESHTFTIKISMKIVFIGVYAINSSTVVYGGDILSFHIFEALNDNFEA